MSSFYDVNGDVVETIRLRASGARSKGDLVSLAAPSSAGDVLADAAVADANAVDRVAVAMHSIASGDIGIYAVRGPVDLTVPTLTITAYHGLKYNNAAIETTAATGKTTCAEANNDFAIALEAGTNATTLRVYLLGEPFTKTT